MSLLTPKQQKFLNYIREFIRHKGYAPTLQDMATHFRLSSLGTVQQYMEALERKGYIRRSNKARGLQIIEKAPLVHQAEGLVHSMVNLPVLGRVAAGKPLEYRKNGEKRNVPHWMLKKPGEHFLLEVRGDSMIEEGILEGDLVIVHRQDRAESGQIVVATIDEEAMIKKIVYKKEGVEFRSANSNYKPIFIPHEKPWRMEGLYCGLLRGT